MQDRKTFLGGTDCAGVLGISKWRTQLQIWAEKVGELEREDISNKIEVEVGLELESYVARKFAKVTGKAVKKVDDFMFHPEHKFIGANRDYELTEENADLEIKTTSAWNAKEFDNGKVPIDYLMQCYHYLMVTGKPRIYLAVLIGNHEFRYYTIDRDDKALNTILKREIDFWNKFVVPKVMPFMVKAEDSDILFRLFPEAKEQTIELDDEAVKLAEMIQAYKEDKFTLEKQIEEAENKLKLMLKENETGIAGNYKITWKNQTTKRLDTNLMKLEAFTFYEKYVKSIDTRVFRIAKTKGGQENGGK